MLLPWTNLYSQIVQAEKPHIERPPPSVVKELSREMLLMQTIPPEYEISDPDGGGKVEEYIPIIWRYMWEQVIQGKN